MSFSELVRHPRGALTPKDKNAGRKILLWVVGIGAGLYLLWRAGFLSKAASAVNTPVSIPNPYHWK
jgi:hypothetical protein